MNNQSSSAYTVKLFYSDSEVDVSNELKQAVLLFIEKAMKELLLQQS